VFVVTIERSCTHLWNLFEHLYLFEITPVSFRPSILSSFSFSATLEECRRLTLTNPAEIRRRCWCLGDANENSDCRGRQGLGIFLRRGLEADGHQVYVVHDGAEAVEAYRTESPDLTILDLNLPVKDGEQVLEEVRLLEADLPLLVLTGRQEVDTRVRCLDRGADDLMLKPFSLSELRARCRALLRRKRDAKLLLHAGDLEVNRLDHSVRRGEECVNLTNKEFSLLEHLMLNRGHCVSRVELLETVWNLEPAQSTNIVDVYINYLRRKLEDSPPGTLIRTVRGRGYMIPSAPNRTAGVPANSVIEFEPRVSTFMAANQ
jgi:DNA-binding response OmpR family regulator